MVGEFADRSSTGVPHMEQLGAATIVPQQQIDMRLRIGIDRHREAQHAVALKAISEAREAQVQRHGECEGRSYRGEHKVLRADADANAHGKKQKRRVARVLDRRAKANQCQSTEEAKGAHKRIADREHHRGDDQAEHDQRLHIRSGVRTTAMRPDIDPGDELSEHEREEQR